MSNQKSFTVPYNPKRAETKLARNKGQKAMKKEGMDQNSWSKKFDPLYGVKGKERWLRIKNR